MQTLNQALSDLLQRGLISKDEAFKYTNMIDELRSLHGAPYKNA